MADMRQALLVRLRALEIRRSNYKRLGRDVTKVNEEIVAAKKRLDGLSR